MTFRCKDPEGMWIADVSSRERQDEEERWVRDFDARRDEQEDRRAELYLHQDGDIGEE